MRCQVAPAALASVGRPGDGRSLRIGLRKPSAGDQPIDSIPGRPHLERVEKRGETPAEPSVELRPEGLQDYDLVRCEALGKRA